MSNPEVLLRANEITRIASATTFNGIKLTGSAATSIKIQVGTGNAAFDTIKIINKKMDASTGLGIHVASFGVSTPGSAQVMLAKLDSAISKVSAQRASLGASQNRLQSVINNLQVASENTSAAESRIRDADIAAETAALTRSQILNQAGTAILAQANQLPQAALTLLRG